MNAISIFPKVDENPRNAGQYLPTTVPPSDVVHIGNGGTIQVASLEGGTTQGNPSVAISVKLPDGKVLLAETTLALLASTARALCAAHGREDLLG